MDLEMAKSLALSVSFTEGKREFTALSSKKEQYLLRSMWEALRLPPALTTFRRRALDEQDVRDAAEKISCEFPRYEDCCITAQLRCACMR